MIANVIVKTRHILINSHHKTILTLFTHNYPSTLSLSRLPLQYSIYCWILPNIACWGEAIFVWVVALGVTKIEVKNGYTERHKHIHTQTRTHKYRRTHTQTDRHIQTDTHTDRQMQTEKTHRQTHRILTCSPPLTWKDPLSVCVLTCPEVASMSYPLLLSYYKCKCYSSHKEELLHENIQQMGNKQHDWIFSFSSNINKAGIISGQNPGGWEDYWFDYIEFVSYARPD